MLNLSAPAPVAPALPNVATFATPVALRDAAASIPADTLAAFRVTFCETFQRKIDGMPNLSAGNAGKLRKQMRDAGNGAHDSALRVMLVSGIPADFFVRKIRGSVGNDADSFNVYAIAKTLLGARLMLSASPLWDSGSDARTLRGTIEGLLAGAHGTRKGIAAYLNTYMTARGAGRTGSYSSGSTQSSSSAHALAALGLLNIPATGDYRIPEGHATAALNALLGNEGQGQGQEEGEEEYLPH